MTSPADPIAVAALVVGVLERLGILNTIGGSIAASFAGEPRSTVDIDVVAALEDGQVAAFVAALSPDFYVNEDAMRRAVRAQTSVNLIHNATMMKVDIFVAGGTPLDEEQLARRLWIRLGNGVELPIHPPEDILLQKLRWFQLGAAFQIVNGGTSLALCECRTGTSTSHIFGARREYSGSPTCWNRHWRRLPASQARSER